jgi:hypothetical protein
MNFASAMGFKDGTLTGSLMQAASFNLFERAPLVLMFPEGEYRQV